jgi:hypothetical protein
VFFNIRKVRIGIQYCFETFYYIACRKKCGIIAIEIFTKAIYTVNIADSLDNSICIEMLQQLCLYLVESLAINEKELFARFGPVIEMEKKKQCALKLLWPAELLQLGCSEDRDVTFFCYLHSVDYFPSDIFFN